MQRHRELIRRDIIKDTHFLESTFRHQLIVRRWEDKDTGRASLRILVGMRHRFSVPKDDRDRTRNGVKGMIGKGMIGNVHWRTQHAVRLDAGRAYGAPNAVRWTFAMAALKCPSEMVLMKKRTHVKQWSRRFNWFGHDVSMPKNGNGRNRNVQYNGGSDRFMFFLV